MIDEGELDWKIVAISLDDPKAHLVNDVDDVEKHFPVRAKPDLIYRPYMDFVLLTFICGDIRVHYTAIRDWFRDYKIPDGKPANRFGLGDKPANKVSSSLYKCLLSCVFWLLKLREERSCNTCGVVFFVTGVCIEDHS